MRVDAVAGELTAPRLGLDRRAVRASSPSQVDTIVHSAASVSFALPLSEAREINVEGTRRHARVRRARRASGGLERYGHISTAYVAGTHAGQLRGVRPRRRPGVPQLLRAVEVRGRAARALARWAAVHDHASEHRRRRPAQRLDVRVQRAVLAAARVRARPVHRGARRSRPRRSTSSRSTTSPTRSTSCANRDGGVGETYHLTAGAERARSRRSPSAASRYFNRPLPRVLSPREFDALRGDGGAERSALEGSSVYFPYFSVGTVFDDAATRARLEPLRHRGLAAGRLPRAAARLRHAQPLGQAADRPRSKRSRCKPASPPPGGLGRRGRCEAPRRTACLGAMSPFPTPHAFAPTIPMSSWSRHLPARSACTATRSSGSSTAPTATIRQRNVVCRRCEQSWRVLRDARSGAATRADGRSRAVADAAVDERAGLRRRRRRQHRGARAVRRGALAVRARGERERDFYDRLCEAVCRLARMRRAVIFRYDAARRRVRAAGRARARPRAVRRRARDRRVGADRGAGAARGHRRRGRRRHHRPDPARVRGAVPRAGAARVRADGGARTARSA